MGRVKLKIKKLENPNGRQSTFAKRKSGILKKANELSILCDIDIVLLMFSPTGKAALCCGTRSSMEEVIAKFSQVTPQERTKRKFESLENLKKTFQKLDHDVNIREFIASSNSTIEDLSAQARILQARISEIHGRLSYWTEPDKINNVEHLGQLEISIRQSIDQLRAHKEHFGQQQQAMQIDNANFVKDWSTCSMQDGIQIPLEQQLQSMSWILNSNTTNIVTEEHNPIPQREVECSASSSFGSYPGYFGTGKSPEITISGQETSFLDELNTGQLKPQLSSHQQFTNTNITPYNPNMHNDMNHQPTLPPPSPPQVYIPMNQREYHMNGFFEAPPPGSSVYNNTNQTRFGSSSSSLPCSLSMFDEYLFSQMQQPN
ncbi:PREDICTED: agamous-like MADS-box protein AGL30 isoform X1 [Camelina sativa]|uniref:Agamous-like MADS-box protein AGL30 isoform X1 n=2 Tax=Camelina sativa TaxID=90675 RepID=A0ABM0TE94_CAMSA|nr:PREDICTED: agamous-like MADS-box protein AGL30 isoform X1 [Camelina sativa]XP_010425077.1 PREDICTED: agamous-like MADS-box protein AGL30 isoform X1 [Camelina sativa]